MSLPINPPPPGAQVSVQLGGAEAPGERVLLQFGDQGGPAALLLRLWKGAPANTPVREEEQGEESDASTAGRSQ